MRSFSRRRFLGRSLAAAGAAAAAGAVTALATGDAHAVQQPVASDSEGMNNAFASGAVVGRGASRVIWSVDTNDPLVALTFDDGPWPEFTPNILDILDRLSVKATFFVMGWNAEHHRDLVAREVAAGHEIGNHTWTHLDLAFQTPEVAHEQLHRGTQVIESLTGKPIQYFRPPRGELTGESTFLAGQLGQDIVMWSVARGPGGVSTPAVVADHVVSSLHPGAIVDLHDGIGRGTFNLLAPGTMLLRERRTVEIQALPAIIERAQAAGFGFVTLSELLARADTALTAAERAKLFVARTVHSDTATATADPAVGRSPKRVAPRLASTPHNTTASRKKGNR